MMPCVLSCRGGLVECDQGLLIHHSTFLKELLGAETCVCSRPVIILPDITVEATLLALNLLAGSGKDVSLEYESLMPAAPVLSMLAVTFVYGFRLQAEEEVHHKWLILFSTAYFAIIFTDIMEHSYFTGYSKSFNCWTFISALNLRVDGPRIKLLNTYHKSGPLFALLLYTAQCSEPFIVKVKFFGMS
jgi:hypothetical protein